MTVFEPGSSGIGSDRCANWATTTAHACKVYECKVNIQSNVYSYEIIRIHILHYVERQ